VVKSRRWDCPSCGMDRKRTLAAMCDTAGVVRMLTLTFEQPAVPGGPLDDLQVEAYRPARHRFCDWNSHGYWYVPPKGKAGREGWRWRIVPDCKHCCRWVSHRLRLLTKRLRRAWPGFEYLHVREVHKSGAMHLHLAVRGVPKSVTRRSASGQLLRRHWREVGGGHLDVGRHGDNAGAGAGWYVGKYLAKQQDDAGFAKGFRRWSRTGGFAPELTMTPRRDPDYDGGWDDPTEALLVGGWVQPDGTESPWRWWPENDDLRADAWAHVTAATRRLDARTAKCPLSLARVLPQGFWEALCGAAVPTPTRDDAGPAWEALTAF
jgi:hypothetical protein